MNIKEIEAFIDKFEKSSIAEMELEADNVRLVLKKAIYSESVKVLAPQVIQNNEGDKEQIKSEAIQKEQTGKTVKAPIVGTFYRAASPGSEPFVKVGQMVKKGDTICMIEAMKIMNEIVSPCDGEVTSINAEDGAFVAYDEILVVIEEK